MAVKKIYIILLATIVGILAQPLYASLPNSGSLEGQKFLAQFREYEWLGTIDPSSTKHAKTRQQKLAGLRAFEQRLTNVIQLQNISNYCRTTSESYVLTDNEVYAEQELKQLKALHKKAQHILSQYEHRRASELEEPQRELTYSPTALVSALIHAVILPDDSLNYEQRMLLTAQLLTEFTNPTRKNTQFTKTDCTRLAFCYSRIQSILNARNNPNSSSSSSSSAATSLGAINSHLSTTMPYENSTISSSSSSSSSTISLSSTSESINTPPLDMHASESMGTSSSSSSIEADADEVLTIISSQEEPLITSEAGCSLTEDLIIPAPSDVSLRPPSESSSWFSLTGWLSSSNKND